ncbi:hypothetical protein CHISP_3108 [Chitinispirillum alkaliphilum]|nr:hypothetical protein CHISP_3108 [Chitinispirillum alkaliphilum]
MAQEKKYKQHPHTPQTEKPEYIFLKNHTIMTIQLKSNIKEYI